MPPTNIRVRDWLLAATVLTSAWLLFQVQPMAGKRILPWFGGGPAVWNTAMLFFQAALLGGYLYAHLSTRLLKPGAQAILHAVLIAAALGVLVSSGIIAGDAWKPAGSDSPRLGILAILAATVGLPYLMLAATAPLVQSWWGRTHAAGSPYRLYALSNFGSLAALVSYPLVVEPLLGLSKQGAIWSATFGVFALLCIASALSASWGAMPTALGGHAHGSSHAHAEPWAGRPSANPAPTRFIRFLWIALPACASALLLAVTNYLCQDVASLPLLWVAPLAVYLVTFIIAFDADRWYIRWAWLAALAIASFAALWSWSQGAGLALGVQVEVHLGLLLVVGMVCHGEVARLRPDASRLTSFYLCLSLGGVLGGLFVAVIAPLAFPDYYELPLSIFAAWLLAMCVLAVDPQSELYRGRRFGAWVGIVILGACFAGLAGQHYAKAQKSTIAVERNFFGVLKVKERTLKSGARVRGLLNGRISHGSQFTATARRGEATTYYGRTTGVGRVLAGPVATPRRIGVVGLGAGTIAAYAEAGDAYRFYDINPQIIAWADKYFTYLEDARRRGATIEVVQGDARLSLERDDPQEFDLLALDAFSGDAIPVHLLTLEAVDLYLRHLKHPGGVLAVHISNRHLDLAPVVRAAAQRYDLEGRIVANDGNEAADVNSASWILLTRRGEGGPTPLGDPLGPGDDPASRPITWTDDHSSLWSVFK